MSDFTHLIVYTYRQGGSLYAIWGDHDTYQKIADTGEVDVNTETGKPAPVAMVAFVKVEELTDFRMSKPK